MVPKDNHTAKKLDLFYNAYQSRITVKYLVLVLV